MMKACWWGRGTSGPRSLRNADYVNFMNLDLIVGSDLNSYLQCRKLEISNLINQEKIFMRLDLILGNNLSYISNIKCILKFFNWLIKKKNFEVICWNPPKTYRIWKFSQFILCSKIKPFGRPWSKALKNIQTISW
jgi:hypothetical protein